MGTMEDREISGCLSACGLRAEQREWYLALARSGQTKDRLPALFAPSVSSAPGSGPAGGDI